MKRLRSIAGATRRRLRAMTGLEAGQSWTPWRIALYTFLAMAAVALLVAWLTGQPLACATRC